MHLLAVPYGDLVLPVELTFGKYVFFKEMVRLDEDERGCGLECHASLYPYYGVTHMYVPSDPVRGCGPAYCQDHLYRAHFLAVE